MSTVSRQASQVVSAVGTFTAAGYIGWVAGAPIVGWVSQTGPGPRAAGPGRGGLVRCRPVHPVGPAAAARAGPRTLEEISMILHSIETPADIKNLSRSTADLCEEIRAFIVDSVTTTGGHLGSNLGAVELTLALHRVFDLPATSSCGTPGIRPTSTSC